MLKGLRKNHRTSPVGGLLELLLAFQNGLDGVDRQKRRDRDQCRDNGTGQAAAKQIQAVIFLHELDLGQGIHHTEGEQIGDQDAENADDDEYENEHGVSLRKI